MTSNGAKSGAAPLLINGEEVTTATTFGVFNPRTEEYASESCSASKKEALEAVAAAAAAFPAWSKTKPNERRDILLKAAELMQSRHDELAQYIMEETGGDDQWAAFNIVTTVEGLKDVAGRIAGAVEGVIPSCNEQTRTALVVKEPYGVVFGMAPWNAPYILGMRAVSFPLAAGNTCVLKGAEASPKCFLAIGRIFRDAGLPPGCLNIIYSRPQDAAEVATAIISDPAVRKVNFTGSTAVGSIIAQLSGKHLKPVLMELGGKAPSIVMPDADISKAALGCALGSFLYAGQICMATERILVHSSIKDKFAEALQATTNHIFDPNADAPVLVSNAGMSKTKKLVDDALAAGAKAIGGRPEVVQASKTRMRPVIIEGVTKDMDLYYKESFGPSVSLMTFEEEAEAIAVANDTEYGLAASVFTENLATGLRIAKQIDTGAIHINSMTVHDEPRLPHGGAKSSGFGRFGGSWGLEEFLKTKTITFTV